VACALQSSGGAGTTRWQRSTNMKTLAAVSLALAMFAGSAVHADEPKPNPPAATTHARKHKKPQKKPAEPKKPEAAPAPTR
jgi:hypothetical protein